MTQEPENKKKGVGIYIKSEIFKTIVIPFNKIGNNYFTIIQETMKEQFEGKCIEEGFVKQNSIRVLLYTCASMFSDKVKFNVTAECLLCNPVEGMSFKIQVKNITKAGIRGNTGDKSPVDVFIARDHYYSNKYFNSVKVGDSISVRVIGTRYEINDKTISVLADLLQPKKVVKKPKLILRE